MSSLRELQDMCKSNGIKFKGKTKSQLVDALKANDGAHEVTEDNCLEKKSVRELRDICAKEGLSCLGTKSELIKRLGPFKNDERGRKVKKPVEIVVDDDPESLDSDEYGNLKKEELKKVCLDRNLPTAGALVKRLQENDDNDDDEEDLNNSQEIIYQTPVAQIRCKSNKRLIVDFVPETPANFVNRENETVSITPPPTFLSPVQRCIPVFATVSPMKLLWLKVQTT